LGIGRADPPAGDGTGGVGCGGAAAEQQAGGLVLQACELQATAGEARGGADLAEDDAGGTAAQGGFHGLEGFGVCAGLDQDQIGGVDAVGQQAGGVEIAAGGDPEQDTAGVGAGEIAGEGCGEGGDDGGGLGFAAFGADFMQLADGQAAAGEVAVDARIAQGQHGGRGWETLAWRGKRFASCGGWGGHEIRGEQTGIVRYLFVKCPKSQG
jgi:hypothetical protein